MAQLQHAGQQPVQNFQITHRALIVHIIYISVVPLSTALAAVKGKACGFGAKITTLYSACQAMRRWWAVVSAPPPDVPRNNLLRPRPKVYLVHITRLNNKTHYSH